MNMDGFGFRELRKSTYGGSRKRITEKMTLVAAVVIVLFVVFAGTCIYRSTAEDITIKVSDKERVNDRSEAGSRYLVWTEGGECFEVTDSYSYLTFRASDRYGRLKRGCSYRVRVVGWRIGCTSMYRNIVEILGELPADQ